MYDRIHWASLALITEIEQAQWALACAMRNAADELVVQTEAYLAGE